MGDGDPVLAEFMRSHKLSAPVENIITVDWTATALNRERLKTGERVVILDCGHYAVTKAKRRTACGQCHEMILNGEDYEGWRNRRTTGDDTETGG